MSVTVSISSKELRRAMRDVENWSEDRINGVKVAVAETALAVDKRAKELAPVDTGRLRSSIRPRFRKQRLEADVFTDVEYAVHQEFGTHKMAAQPFMNPAAESQRRPFVARIKKVLRDTRRVRT